MVPCTPLSVVAVFLALGLFVNEEYLTKKPHTAHTVAPSNDENLHRLETVAPPEGSTRRQFSAITEPGGSVTATSIATVPKA